MGTDQIRRWESGALAHGVNDPFGQGPLPWLRGADSYVEGFGPGATETVIPWYVDLDAPGQQRLPGARRTQEGAGSTGAPRSSDDVVCQIKGFASAGVVRPGGSVDFRVTVNPPREFTVDVYRIGHYGGAGAHHMTAGPAVSGLVQPTPMVVGRTVSCHHWWLSWRLHVPAHWQPGAYVAVLTTIDNSHRSHIPFTVRGTRPADLLLVLPDVTWQAYNLFPEDGRTGASLYHAWDADGRLVGEEDAAVTVSFDRPYAGAGLPLHVGHAYDFARWAERAGYDLDYATATDLHTGGIDPTRYRGLVFPGHDEYWSAGMREAAEGARAVGTSLVFLAANTMYWRVELAPSPAGEQDRLVSCRKRRRPGPGVPFQGPAGARSALWRDTGEPEQRLLGIQYAGRVPEPAPLIARNVHHWLWEGTGLREEEPVPGLVAGEADRYYPRVALPEHRERVLLAHSPYRDVSGVVRHQETSLYRAPSGAWVFAAGSFAWSPALDRPGHTDERIQRATANLLDRVCGRD